MDIAFHIFFLFKIDIHKWDYWSCGTIMFMAQYILPNCFPFRRAVSIYNAPCNA